IALVGRLVPLTPIGYAPLRRRLTSPPLPARRGHRIVADRHAKDRHRDVCGLDHYPWTVPARTHIPHTSGEGPVLVAVEEDVGGSARRIVDGTFRNHHEGGRTRELNADVDAHPHLGMSRHSNRARDQRCKNESLHDLLHSARSRSAFSARFCIRVGPRSSLASNEVRLAARVDEEVYGPAFGGSKNQTMRESSLHRRLGSASRAESVRTLSHRSPQVDRSMAADAYLARRPVGQAR